MENPSETIERFLGPYLVQGKRYPTTLPEELSSWYCYTSDGGHSVVIAVKSKYHRKSTPDEFLVPAPVKTVLRGYEQRDGYILVDLPYDTVLGLVVPEGDDEF